MSRVHKTRRRRWHVLEEMIREHGWRTGAELGVFRGQTFLHLLATCPDLTLVGVDLWRPMPGKEEAAGGRSYAAHDLEAYYRNVKLGSEVYGDRAWLLRMSTVEAARYFPDRHFDFVFIDADHTYEGVMADIEAWEPKVSGRLMGHDYNEADFPGVVQAVNEVFGTPQIHPCHIWSVPC